MEKKKTNRVKAKEYVRGTGYYVISSFKGFVFTINWLLISLIASLLILSSSGHWFFKVVLYLGVIPALITYYLVGRFQKRIGRKVKSKALKNIQKADQALGEAFVLVTDPENADMYGAYAGNRWMESLVVFLFLFGFTFFGVIVEYLLRLNSGFEIFAYHEYSAPLRIYLCWLALLSVQIYLFIWTQMLRRWRSKMIWGDFHQLFSPSQ